MGGTAGLDSDRLSCRFWPLRHPRLPRRTCLPPPLPAPPHPLPVSLPVPLYPPAPPCLPATLTLTPWHPVPASPSLPHPRGLPGSPTSLSLPSPSTFPSPSPSLSLIRPPSLGGTSLPPPLRPTRPRRGGGWHVFATPNGGLVTLVGWMRCCDSSPAGWCNSPWMCRCHSSRDDVPHLGRGSSSLENGSS